MKDLSFRLIIRRFVLATAFPPFIGIYRLFYKFVIYLSTRLFRKFPEIRAVYLRRGGAKGEIIPLISDIDFAVITHDMNEEDRNELLIGYDVLVNTTTLLDKSLELYEEDNFLKHYETSDYFQYRFMEGKKTWKLIFGNDYLAQLPELPIHKLYGGFYTEVKIWWTIFEWRFFQNRKYNGESITRNNTCYKAVSEILKMNLALNKDILEFNRNKALELSKDFFAGNDLRLLEKLKSISEKNFRSDDLNILEDTKNFLLKYLDNFYRESRDHPYVKPSQEKTQRVVCPGDEMLLTKADKEHVNHLVDFVKANWRYTYMGSYLVSSVYFNADEFLFMVKIDTEKIPSSNELTAFNLFHSNANYNGISRIKLFLLFPDSAFQINTDDFKMSWQSVLSPCFNPDIFELLQRSESIVDGESYKVNKFSVWNKPVEHFLCEEKRLFFELLKDPSVYKLNNLDFLRIFWKTAQLAIVNRSAKKSEIVYPLTLASIEKALIEENMPLPGELKVFADAYINELSGKSDDISLQIHAAINFLRDLDD